MSKTANRTSSNSIGPGPLPKHVCKEIWTHITDKLQDGEPLLTNGDFAEVAEQVYADVTASEVSDTTRIQIREMVEAVNRSRPDTYLAKGFQNKINSAFEEGVKRLNWDLAKIQEKGAQSLRRFTQRDEVKDLFEEANLSSEHIDVLSSVAHMVDQISGPREEEPVAPKREERPSPPPEVEQPEVQQAPSPFPSAPKSQEDEAVEAAVANGEVDGGEAKQRVQQQEKRRTELEVRELEKVPQHLDALVDQGVVTETEAAQLRQLTEVDERVKKGEIDEQEATHIRNSILTGETRDKLERKIKEAVADSVRYLQVFESMQKIDPSYHDALTFLIEHKHAVVSQGDIDLGDVLKGLMEDVELLDKCIDVMERKDQELRMISVRLHPYNSIMGRGLERIGNMIIDETFIEDLDKLDSDGMSERLNSPDQLTRVRPAADMLCMISIVDHVSKKTRFRKELRLLRIGKQVEEFYQGTSDLKEARHQAENFLNRRLRRLFPDMTSDEAAELKQRSTEMMDQIEGRIRDERQAQTEADRKNTEAAAVVKSSGGDGDEMELSDEEIQKGVQIGRVEMRVAGSTRRIPQKIMPDPDDPTQFLIVSRDPETQELVPAMKRGQKRLIERNREGTWVEIKG